MRLWAGVLLPALAWAQTLTLHVKYTLGREDDKVGLGKEAKRLLSEVRGATPAYDKGTIRFLENLVEQFDKMNAAVEEQKAVDEAVPQRFTAGKYQVKDMKKIRAKKCTVKSLTVEELRSKLADGSFKIDQPMIVRNVTSLVDWEKLQRSFALSRLMKDEKSLPLLEYWKPDQARARLVGNQIQMSEPSQVSFSRYGSLCHVGKLGGTQTDHCEQTVGAHTMATAEELQMFNMFPEFNNTFYAMDEFRKNFAAAGGSNLQDILGESAKQWLKSNGQWNFRFFTFGPAGSGGQLRMEQGLPFYEFLIHGSRRWLLMTDKEIERVAAKAREALEFQQTSAYMFFEEKLPELQDEFDLKKYQECNQDAGDIMFVPNGWYRVSVATQDAISFYEQLLNEKEIFKLVVNQQTWMPQMRQFDLGFCYPPDEVEGLGGFANEKQRKWLIGALKDVKDAETVQATLTALVQCGGALALRSGFPHLEVDQTTVCSANAWKKCRAMLEKKLKGKSASLSWIPEKAPKSPILKAAKQEL